MIHLLKVPDHPFLPSPFVRTPRTTPHFGLADKEHAMSRIPIEVTFLNKILPRAQAVGEAVANSEFVTMLNPKYRGDNFKWENFVAFAVRRAEVSCWQSFTDAEWKRWEKEIKAAACKSAEYAAKRLLDESGLLEWWPDPTHTPVASREVELVSNDAEKKP